MFSIKSFPAPELGGRQVILVFGPASTPGVKEMGPALIKIKAEKPEPAMLNLNSENWAMRDELGFFERGGRS